MKACFFHAIEMLSPQRENVSPLICSCRSPELTVGVPWIISIQYHGQLLGARKIRFLRILSCFFQRPQLNSWVEKIRWRKDRLPTPVFLGFPCGSAGIESAHNPGDLGSIPGLERSPGEGKGYPLQYSGLENSTDRGYRSWGPKELDTTEQLTHTTSLWKICLVLKELVLKIE